MPGYPPTIEGRTSPSGQTPEVVVGNTAPEVQSITFDPYPPRTGEPLVARIAGKDVDGDEITYTYVWRRNKEIVQEGSLDRLETKGFTRGDEILLEVIPHDGNNPGLSQQPEPMMLANGRPMVTSLPPESIDNGRFLYNVVTAKEVKVGVVVG